MVNDENGYEDSDIRLIDSFSEKFKSSSLIFYLIATTPFAFALGVWSGSKFLLPLIITIQSYPVFLVCYIKKWYKRLVVFMLIWAILISFMGVLITNIEPDLMTELVFRGADYKEEMWEWLETGGGAEGTISIFFPQHMFHLGIFILGTVLSGGFLGLFMGSVLLNYMNYYVGIIGINSSSSIVMFFGWPPWAILRVVGYIILAVAFSKPLYALLRREKIYNRRLLGYFFVGIMLIICDIIIKYLLADVWRDLLLRWVNIG